MKFFLVELSQLRSSVVKAPARKVEDLGFVSRAGHTLFAWIWLFIAPRRVIEKVVDNWRGKHLNRLASLVHPSAFTTIRAVELHSLRRIPPPNTTVQFIYTFQDSLPNVLWFWWRGRRQEVVWAQTWPPGGGGEDFRLASGYSVSHAHAHKYAGGSLQSSLLTFARQKYNLHVLWTQSVFLVWRDGPAWRGDAGHLWDDRVPGQPQQHQEAGGRHPVWGGKHIQPSELFVSIVTRESTARMATGSLTLIFTQTLSDFHFTFVALTKFREIIFD